MYYILSRLAHSVKMNSLTSNIVRTPLFKGTVTHFSESETYKHPLTKCPYVLMNSSLEMVCDDCQIRFDFDWFFPANMGMNTVFLRYEPGRFILDIILNEYFNRLKAYLNPRDPEDLWERETSASDLRVSLEKEKWHVCVILHWFSWGNMSCFVLFFKKTWVFSIGIFKFLL